MNGCQFGFGSSALRGKVESGGGLCVSLPVEMSTRHSKTAPMRRSDATLRCDAGTAALAGISSGTHQEYVDGEVI